jgi:hypothetical protein
MNPDPTVPDPSTGDVLRAYTSSSLYEPPRTWLGGGNPFRRPLGPDAGALDLARRPGVDEACGAAALEVHRMLLNVYEADLVFLSDGSLERCWDDFREFYGDANRTLGERLRPALERFAFGFLDDAVDVTGRWGAPELERYLRALSERDLTAPSVAHRAVQTSTDPARAARMWLVQFAPDFLSEASPMVRNLLGSFGPQQSEWFKIVIDEYGYGVHSTKHSTLFEQTLTSVGLSAQIHRYWPHYLAGSLLMNNYFHFLGKNHRHLFRYLGTLYYTETALVEFCRNATDLLREVLPDGVDVTYFTEHVHIDTHHGRMALEDLVLPLVDRCGERVVPEVLRGFEEYQVVADVVDRDFAEQVAFMDDLAGPGGAAPSHVPDAAGRHSRLRGDEVLASRSRPTATVHRVDEGALRLVAGLDAERTLGPGDVVRVPRGRVYGGVAGSDGCSMTCWAEPACSS